MQKNIYSMITFAKKSLESQGYGYFWREKGVPILKGHMERGCLYGVRNALSQPE